MTTGINDFFGDMVLTVLLLLVYVLLYRKYIFSLYDPLLFFLLTNTFTTVLMFREVDSPQHLVYFVLCQLALWLGFTRFSYNLQLRQEISFNAFNLKLLKITLYCCFVVYLAANVYAASRVGFPLFNEDPTGAKAGLYVGGLGIVRRINWGLSIFLSCGCFFMLFISKNKKPFTFILFCQLVFIALSGSKGGLLVFLFMLAYIIKRPGLQSRLHFRVLNKYKKYLKYILGAGVAVAVTVLYTERGSLGNAFYGLYNRLLLSGDVILYYYQPHIYQHFQQSYAALSFVPAELNSVMGLLRLVEYKYPFGYEMVRLHLQHTGEEVPTTVIGPNTQFFIKGHIFFGFAGGVIYTFFVGLLIGFLRKNFFDARRFSSLYFTFSYAFVVMAFSFAIESGLFISQVFDMLLFVLPITFFCYTLLKLQEAATSAENQDEAIVPET